jgi:hypothetical protein
VDQSSLIVDAVMELLGICSKTTYFQVSYKFYQETDGMAMGSPLSPVISNIYMEKFKKVPLEQSDLRPKTWLRYIDDIFTIWPW